MVYVHILTTLPALREYAIPVKTTNKKISSVSFSLPKIKTLNSALSTIKEENLLRTCKYKKTFETYSRLSSFYKNNDNFKNIVNSLPQDDPEFPFYDSSYFNQPNLYIDFKENSRLEYLYVSFIIEKNILPFIELNDENCSTVDQYLINFLPNLDYLNKSKFFIKDCSGKVLHSA
jgi:hypothetical protein